VRVGGVGGEGVLAWVREGNERCPRPLATKRAGGEGGLAGVGEGKG
jgi:hypothetical protein